MNYVEPIRDVALVKDIDEYLSKNTRDQLLFEFGIYTGLRISDILKFKVYDVQKDTYTIREQKTGKQKSFEFNPILKKNLNEYIKGKENNEYLFKSRMGINKPISRVRAYQILKHLQKIFSSSTMWKKFGSAAKKSDSVSAVSTAKQANVRKKMMPLLSVRKCLMRK